MGINDTSTVAEMIKECHERQLLKFMTVREASARELPGAVMPNTKLKAGKGIGTLNSWICGVCVEPGDQEGRGDLREDEDGGRAPGRGDAQWG